jgi:hypothetical protein
MEVTAPVALTLLRAVAPDLPLQVGAVLGARVLDREGARGTLLLAGARLSAQLPEGVGAGDALRVRVQETTGEKLVLKVLDAPQQAQGSSQAPGTQGATMLPPLALPGGAQARIVVEPEEEGAGGRRAEEPPRSVFVRYDSPVLGRVDIALTLTGHAIGAAVQLSAGEPARTARMGSASLQGALAAAADRPALVQVLARDETVNVSA